MYEELHAADLNFNGLRFAPGDHARLEDWQVSTASYNSVREAS